MIIIVLLALSLSTVSSLPAVVKTDSHGHAVTPAPPVKKGKTLAGAASEEHSVSAPGNLAMHIPKCTKFGRFALQGECHAYVHCDYIGATPDLQRCHDNNLFDSMTFHCVHPHEAYCGVCSSYDYNTPKNHGFWCSNDVLVMRQCPMGSFQAHHYLDCRPIDQIMNRYINFKGEVFNAEEEDRIVQPLFAHQPFVVNVTTSTSLDSKDLKLGKGKEISMANFEKVSKGAVTDVVEISKSASTNFVEISEAASTNFVESSKAISANPSDAQISGNAGASSGKYEGESETSKIGDENPRSHEKSSSSEASSPNRGKFQGRTFAREELTSSSENEGETVPAKTGNESNSNSGIGSRSKIVYSEMSKSESRESTIGILDSTVIHSKTKTEDRKSSGDSKTGSNIHNENNNLNKIKLQGGNMVSKGNSTIEAGSDMNSTNSIKNVINKSSNADSNVTLESPLQEKVDGGNPLKKGSIQGRSFGGLFNNNEGDNGTTGSSRESGNASGISVNGTSDSKLAVVNSDKITTGGNLTLTAATLNKQGGEVPSSNRSSNSESKNTNEILKKENEQNLTAPMVKQSVDTIKEVIKNSTTARNLTLDNKAEQENPKSEQSSKEDTSPPRGKFHGRGFGRDDIPSADSEDLSVSQNESTSGSNTSLNEDHEEKNASIIKSMKTLNSSLESGNWNGVNNVTMKLNVNNTNADENSTKTNSSFRMELGILKGVKGYFTELQSRVSSPGDNNYTAVQNSSAKIESNRYSNGGNSTSEKNNFTSAVQLQKEDSPSEKDLNKDTSSSRGKFNGRRFEGDVFFAADDASVETEIPNIVNDTMLAMNSSETLNSENQSLSKTLTTEGTTTKSSENGQGQEFGNNKTSNNDEDKFENEKMSSMIESIDNVYLSKWESKYSKSKTNASNITGIEINEGNNSNTSVSNVKTFSAGSEPETGNLKDSKITNKTGSTLTTNYSTHLTEMTGTSARNILNSSFYTEQNFLSSESSNISSTVVSSNSTYSTVKPHAQNNILNAIDSNASSNNNHSWISPLNLNSSTSQSGLNSNPENDTMNSDLVISLNNGSKLKSNEKDNVISNEDKLPHVTDPDSSTSTLTNQTVNRGEVETSGTSGESQTKHGLNNTFTSTSSIPSENSNIQNKSEFNTTSGSSTKIHKEYKSDLVKVSEDTEESSSLEDSSSTSNTTESGEVYYKLDQSMYPDNDDTKFRGRSFEENGSKIRVTTKEVSEVTRKQLVLKKLQNSQLRAPGKAISIQISTGDNYFGVETRNTTSKINLEKKGNLTNILNDVNYKDISSEETDDDDEDRTVQDLKVTITDRLSKMLNPDKTIETLSVNSNKIVASKPASNRITINIGRGKTKLPRTSKNSQASRANKDKLN